MILPIALGFDANNYIAAAWHATQGLGNRTAAGLFTQFVEKMVLNVKPIHVLIAYDASGETFRKKLCAEYKANRKPRDPDLQFQLDKSLEMMRQRNFRCERFDEFESDDVLATYAAKNTEMKRKTVISSTDKDFFQILDPGMVSLYRKMPGSSADFSVINVYTAENFEAEWGLRVHQWPEYLAIAGDGADNWKGVPGVGKVGAIKHLHGEPLKPKQAACMAAFDLGLALRITTLRRDVPFDICEVKEQGEVLR